MARVVGVEHYRNVELKHVPADILASMLRNCIRFTLIKDPTDPKQLGFMPDTINQFMRGLHQHTQGLFFMDAQCEDEYSAIQQSVFEVRIYFELLQDMESFKQDFLLLYKLGN